MFFKKKKKQLHNNNKEQNRENVQSEAIENEMDDDVPAYFEDGKGSFWDIISPDGIDAQHKDIGYIADSLSGERVFRPLYITRGGWPRKLQTDWISSFIDAGETDLTIYVEKIPGRQAVFSLKRMMTMLQSNLRAEQKRGNIDQLHDIQTKIDDTEALMEDIAFGQNDLFHASVQACVFADDDEILDKLCDHLEDDLGGQFIHVRSAYQRIKEGFLSALPRGKNELKDTYRNLDRRSLSTLFPFASSELKYTGGVPFAINQQTGNLVFLDVFADSNDNYNMSIFGQSGSGKSFALKTLIGRNLLKNVHTAILDPEGETKKMTKRLGGIYIKIGTDYPVVINPCALSVTEVELDDDDDELKFIDDGRQVIQKDGKEFIRFVPVKEKVNEILSFFNILVQGDHGQPLDNFEENYLDICIKEAFNRAEIDANPNSLYEEKAKEVDGKIVHDLVLKPEVTLSDIYDVLTEKFSNEVRAERLFAAIQPWLRDGTRGLFDGQTYFGQGVSTNIDDAKIVTFDISDLEEGSLLRKLGYQVCLTWIWQKFIKSEKNAKRYKMVIADEFWQMVNSEDTVNFAEKVARRCRKRNASFCIASQDADRILNNEKARGVVTNSAIQLLFRQNSLNMETMKNSFDLSEGELSVIMGKPKKGEGLLRVQGDSVWIRTDPFDFEKILFESNQAKMAELEQQLERNKQLQEMRV